MQGQRPGPQSSIVKLVASDLHRHINALGMKLFGYAAMQLRNRPASVRAEQSRAFAKQVGSACRAALFQQPGVGDFRRQQRNSAHHHRKNRIEGLTI